MTVVYYVSAHGLGHFIRAGEVIKALPRETPLILRTDVDERYIRQVFGDRAPRVERARFDCGAIGADSLSVDARATFEAAEAMQRANDEREGEEVAFLRSVDARVVVADAPPFALRVARRAGVPSMLIANFTWVEIYARLVDRARARGEADVAESGERLVERLKRELSEGDLHLIPGLALPMEACRRRLEVPIVARRGRDRRELLCERLGLSADAPLHLVYLGLDGCAGVDFAALDRLDGEQFFAFEAVPGDAAGRVRVMPEGLLDHADATASADGVVGKLGYSLCAECAAHGKPIVYPPRPDFAEADALAAGMERFGLGVAVSAEDFRALRWGPALQRARELSAAARPIAADGAPVCAQIIAETWRRGGMERSRGGGPPRVS